MAASRQATPPPSAQMDDPLIDGRFRILPGSRLETLGGYDSVAAQDLRSGAEDIVALRAHAGTPVRAQLPGFMQARHESLFKVLAHGAVGASFWVVTGAPPGPSLASLASPWSGNALLTQVLRPAALALDQLQMNGLTHRAIRPDNVFVASGGRGVVLGPCWMGPPAFSQPAMFEPAYSAICAPAARGDGTIMDDVYALGVLLLALHTRAVPLSGVSPQDIIQLKLEHGSYAALTGQTRLAHNFEEILRAMLADDPLARPQPHALARLDAIHASRGAQRGTRPMGRPIKLGERFASNRRMLALLCAEQPTEAMVLLRQGAMAQWLNRGPEDAALITRLEELRRDDLSTGGHASSSPLGGDFALTELVALLDPLAPLFWRGRWLWPDALGSILAASLTQPASATRDASALLDDMLNRRVASRWQQWRSGRPEQGGPKLPARLLRMAGVGDTQRFMARIAYALNPYLACASPNFAGELIVTMSALMAALESAAAEIDVQCLAYLDARLEEAEGEPATGSLPGAEAMRELWMLARCQRLVACGPRPRIAASLLPRLETLLDDWPGVSRRRRRLADLRALAGQGDLAAMLVLLSDGRQRREDEAARERAAAEVDTIHAVLEEQTRTMPQSLERSLDAARDTASAAGMLCIMAALFLELLSR